MERKQRLVLVAIMWGIVFLSTPFITLVLLDHDTGSFSGRGLLPAGLFTGGLVTLNVLLFIMALLCSKFSNELDEMANRPVERQNPQGAQDSLSKFWEEMDAEQQFGIRLLRMAPGSPLRGELQQRAIVRTINGTTPATAAEANSLLESGINEIEWQDAQGKIHLSQIIVQNNDLKAQFEQVSRPVAQPTQA